MFKLKGIFINKEKNKLIIIIFIIIITKKNFYLWIKKKMKRYLKSNNFIMLITNYKIIKFEYKLNLNINKKLLVISIFKGKEYIILKALLLLLLLIRNILKGLLILILLQLKTIK